MLNIPPHLKPLVAFLDEMNKESDRGAVLVAAAMLEDMLGACIRAFLVEHKDTEKLLEGFNAPFGTLSSRILGAFAMGLLSEREYAECQTLRKIRNEFAHNVHLSFETQKIIDLCNNLKFAAQGSTVDAKGKFHTAAASLIAGLTNRAFYVGEARLKYGNWKY